MLIAMTCSFTDTPIVLEFAADSEHMIDQLCGWTVDSVLAPEVQAQITYACAQENFKVGEDSGDGLLPILLEPEGLVVYIQNIGEV